MADLHSLLSNVWREACRHIEIGDSTSLIAPLLGQHLPVNLVLVRRIDLQRSCLETVGTGVSGQVVIPEHTRNDLTPDNMEKLLTWCRQGQVLQLANGSQSPESDLLLPAQISGDVLAGPLSTTEGPIGVLLLIAGENKTFNAAHLELVQRLLEPFSTALENDLRLREMTTLREAAEADRLSLLTRLGRQDITEVIVGAEAGLKHVIERVDLVARSDVPVLIFGETGSGKEVVARAIHTRSRRSAAPFLRVNCGAIPSELIDSELFGHERGSFTGAIGMRKGWFERADGGTLFLDEIGELPPAAQVRLLRILQDGAFERVGGQKQLIVDVRIVAATHRDLQAMLVDGRFREDLWYRIAVFPIHLPPLRSRPEDVPPLATHFALRACRRFGFLPHVPTSDDMNLLCSYSWPGNVRELAAVIDRAAILGDGNSLEVAKALGNVAKSPQRNISPTPAENTDGFLTLDAAMTRHIQSALTTTNGRIEGQDGAAHLLGINPHTLRARMRKLGIDWKRFR